MFVLSFRGVTVGSCATFAREPSQGRKAAALSGNICVPQTTCPSPYETRAPSGYDDKHMAYQSLYRRYRPQKFSEIRGQAHVVRALRNAVSNDQVGHAYLFHGPRGTGKTTSARVLAKALNCTQLGEDSEPCGTCESCKAIEQGRSFDLHELDAASNNGVEDMRDLLGKVNLGTPGKMKVYILDEVHMLTRGAENSLLKTLEEPPSHVVWVLATTEPHKVVETIRSRCQVFELRLLGAEEMTSHVQWVVEDASLAVDEKAVDYAVSVGAGSVRDTLSALDRVVAAGGVIDLDTSTDQLLHALAEKNPANALQAVSDALSRGRDPRTIGEMLLAGLRDAFLTAMGSPPPRITVPDQERATTIAQAMSPAQLTRALENIGEALVDMRQAPDPRVQLEVALVRLSRSTDETSVAALLKRIERLEARLSTNTVPTASNAASAQSFRPGAARTPVPTTPATAAPTPPPPATVNPVTQSDLVAMQPNSPTHVVALAGIHLSIGRDLVTSEARKMFGENKAKRSPEELKTLWKMLVAKYGTESVVDQPNPVTSTPDELAEVPNPISAQPNPQPTQTDPKTDPPVNNTNPQDEQLNPDQLDEHLMETFPGAQNVTVDQSDQ